MVKRGRAKSAERQRFIKLVRFAHSRNNVMLESWNDGPKETRIQNTYDFIDIFVLMDYFSAKNQKIDAWRASSKKVNSTFAVG